MGLIIEKVSIVLPCYNVSEYLDKAVKSILNQSYSEWEAIFIDDGSKDDTWEILKKIEKLDYRFKIYQKSNEGSGLARNYGLDKATGTYIFFMDPDDWLEPNLLSDNVLFFDNHDIDLVIFGYKEVNEAIRKQKFRNSAKSKIIMEDSNFKYEISDLEECLLFNPPWNKIYKKNFLDRNNVRFTAQKKGQDAIFNIEVFKNVSSLYLNKEIYYNYVVGRIGSAQTSYNDGDFKYAINILKNKLSLYEKYGGNILQIQSNSLVEEVYYNNLKVYRNISKSKDFFNNSIKTEPFGEVKFRILTSKNKLKYILIKIPIFNFILLRLTESQ